MSIYPKASAPLTKAVLHYANARAERWRTRLSRTRTQVDAVLREWEHGKPSAECGCATCELIEDVRAALTT